MCPELPLWFIALATFGAVCLVTLIIVAILAYFAWLFADKDEVKYVQQIKRPLFRQWWVR